MVTAANWALETTFPSPFGAFITLLSTVTELALARVVPLACFVDYNHYRHLFVVTLGPLGLMVVLVVSMVALARRGCADHSQRCAIAALFVSFLTLPTTSTALFKTFQCETLDNGESFLLAVSSTACVRA